MGTETTKVVLDLDNDEFMSKLRESLGLIGELGSGEGFEGLTSALVGIGEIAGVIGAAFFAIKTAVDWVEEAEKIKQVNQAFEVMAESVGIVADKLKNDLVGATKGLASETDVLVAANKAIAGMGENAAKLPQIMEIARKATAVFGGDLIQNFETINQALAAGNVRMLKHYGIIVDTDKATKEYAKSLGVGAEYLSESGRRQAIFNQALEQAQDKFKDVDTTITETSQSFKKISVSLTEMKEAAAIAWEAVAGPAVRKFVGDLADNIHLLATRMKESFGKGKEQTDAHREAVEKSTQKLREMIEVNKDVWGPSELQHYNEMLHKNEQELEKINAQEERSMQLQMKKDGAGAGEKEAAPVTKSKQINNEKFLADQKKVQEELLKLEKDRITAEEKLETDANNFKKMRADEIVRIRQEAALKQSQLDKQAHEKGLMDDTQLAAAKLNVEKKMEADIKQVRLKAQDDEIQALKNLEKQNENTAKGFAAAWKKNGAQAGKDVKSFAHLGEISFKAVSSHAISAFKAMGDGSQSAADAMKSFMFGAIGEIAQKHGEVMVLEGIGTYNWGEVAAGAALIALGSAIAGMGSSSGSSAPSTSAGSSAPDNFSGASSQPGAAPAPQAAPHKSVSITIHGSLFETDQTRNRIMEMVRQAGDFTDFDLKQVGQP